MKLLRAYARRLVIANWKGVIFHCFDLDRHVTGLEGQNGSGKTTIMAAFVTAILPNQRLLAFRNINGAAQAGRGDNGLWGRLGEDSVCYSLIEWITPRGKSVWAGVAMQRGASPSIEIKNFLIEDLSPEAVPHDVLLIRQGGMVLVPQLPQLRDHITAHGGRLTTPKNLGDYMKALFDRGITPMPMTNYEEQERFYRVLSTSMEGSALAGLVKTGLRDYLLTADASLERRTVLMRETLDECRKTKRELELAESAHAEIKDLFDAAWKMASFALFGALGRYEQELGNWRQQGATAKAQRAKYADESRAVAQLGAELTALCQQLELARANAASGERDLDNKQKAFVLRSNLEQARSEQAALERSAAEAHIRYNASAQAEQQAVTERDAAQADHTRLAEELGNMQQAYESLIRRVSELHIARERLSAAQLAMRPMALDRHNAAASKQQLDAEYEAATRSQTDAQSRFDAADDHRQRFETLHQQLGVLAQAQSETPPAPAQAYAYAIELDVKLRDSIAAAARIGSLESQLVQVRSAALQQQQLRQQALALGVGSSAELASAQAAVHAQLSRYDREQERLENELAARQTRLLAMQGELPKLQEALRCYQLSCSVREALRRLEPSWSSLASATALQEAAGAGRHEWSAVEERRRVVEVELRQAKERIHVLEHSPGTLDVRVGTIAEHVEGSLLSSRFDDLPAQEAAVTEARLGIWTDAIVVEAPEHAARLAAQLADRPDTLLFLSEAAAQRAHNGFSLEDSELIQEGQHAQAVARLTRRPERPVLGRRARQAEIARLLKDATALESTLSTLRERSRVLQQSLGLASDWLALGSAAWEADPQPALLSLQAEVAAFTQEISALRASLAGLRDGIADERRRQLGLSELESQRSLLDPPLLSETVLEVQRELEAAVKAGQWVERRQATVQQVLMQLPILASVPDPVHHRQLAKQIAGFKQARERMSAQRDALGSLLRVIDHLDREEDERNYLEQTSVIQTLKSQLPPAKARLDACQQHWKDASDELRAAQTAHVHHDGILKQSTAQCNALQSELTSTGFAGTAEEVELSRQHLQRIQTTVAHLSKEHEVTNTNHIVAGTRLESLRIKVDEQTQTLTQQLAVLRGERRARRELHRLVCELGLHGQIDSQANREKHLSAGSPINTFQQSQRYQGTLLERLRPYPEVVDELKKIEGFAEVSGERRAIQTLHALHRVRLHIAQRIPRTLASADEPHVALAQMAEKMIELRRTLEAQEQEMRNRSSGLADGIAVRQRSAKALVNRLNKELEQVSFGSIRGLKIKPSQPEDMELLLACLRRDNQLSLLDSTLPLEEELARLYHRATGGNIQGARLLDYRNYLRLHLEVQRLNGKWEATDGLSTGEAIGVGAAVLIMILRTWNEEAHRISGSAGYAMQQILLDEANRLDQAALDTLTEFCQRMDVQALVAAPGLDKPRRSTVFQLHRSLRGKDEVVTIRGTRISA